MSSKTIATSVIEKANFGLTFLFRRVTKMICSAFLQSCFDYAFNVYCRELKKVSKSDFKQATIKWLDTS